VRDARPCKDHCGVTLISDVLPFGRLWYIEPNAISNAVDYAKFRSCSHDAVIRVYDEAGNVIESISTHWRVQRVAISINQPSDNRMLVYRSAKKIRNPGNQEKNFLTGLC
jgi:hypothetical protein